jgi:hypothetical protein
MGDEMKLKIEKLATGVRVELVTDTAKKPVAYELTAVQAQLLRDLIDTALRSGQFRFELEL